jgi:small subunit ribosomal protein S2
MADKKAEVKASEESETKEEIIKDIEESGVSEEIAKKEEALDEKKQLSKKADPKTAEAKASASLKDAKAESQENTPEAKDLEEKKKALLAKAAKLKEKLSEEGPKSEELKEQVKIKKRTDMLVPLEEYVKAGIYLGTKVVTPDMRPFVYRRRADGLAIFNTDLIDEKLKEGIIYLSKFNAEDIILVCKRQAGWKAAEKFSELTGIRVFAKKYPAGVLTNTSLPDFFENELTIVTDHWLDKNALNDTVRVNKNVLMICDTNNFSKNADQVIIGNNKSTKSLGVIFYLLARGFMKAKGMDTTKVPDLEWWTELDENKK